MFKQSQINGILHFHDAFEKENTNASAVPVDEDRVYEVLAKNSARYEGRTDNNQYIIYSF